MNYCPLCGNDADVTLPEWSGGKYSIKCTSCGDYTTNKITIDELDALRMGKSKRIQELQYSIAIAKERRYITKSQRSGMIVLETGCSKPVTKLQKNLRRKGKIGSDVFQVNCIKSHDGEG